MNKGIKQKKTVLVLVLVYERLICRTHMLIWKPCLTSRNDKSRDQQGFFEILGRNCRDLMKCQIPTLNLNFKVENLFENWKKQRNIDFGSGIGNRIGSGKVIRFIPKLFERA